MISDLHKFASFIVNKSFRWGVYDCNTVAIIMSDYYKGTNMCEEILFTYNDEKSAMKKAIEIDSKEFLEKHGYKEVPFTILKDGDILLKKDKFWYCMHYYLGDGSVVSSVFDHGVVKTPLKSLADIEFINMRLD